MIWLNMIVHYWNIEDFRSEVCYHSGPKPLSIAEIIVAENRFPLLKCCFCYSSILGNQDSLRVFADKFERTESTVYNVIGMVIFFDHHFNYITMPKTWR
jgi:hypothetical protein